MRKEYGALVVGAGIGGIRAALDLAVSGHKVALVDKRPGVGGILMQLDHQFPSDNCGMCKMLPLMARDSSSQYCLRKGLFHDNIDIYLSTELETLEGDPGQFLATLTQRSPLVDPHKCISCGECAAVCPVRVPSEFNAGLTERGAVYLPIPYAIPNHYVVDLDNCARCWQCFEACPTGAINFHQDEQAGFRILAAADDKNVRERLETWIGLAGFPAEVVSSGDTVLDNLAKSAAAAATGESGYGMLILDLDIKDTDPERILTRSRELCPDMPVVLLAEPENQERAEAMVREGARDWIAKPLDEKTFIPWLDKLHVRLASDRTLRFEVGAVVLACGFDCYDPGNPVDGVSDVLGYGLYPGVVTALEFERMLSSTGPGGGPRHEGQGTRLERADGEPVRRIAWIQCVGSRDLKKKADFCSSICCMFSIKEALLAKKVLGSEVEASIFYMDMRTFGKDFHQYRLDAEQERGVRFLRSRPHSVIPDGKGGLAVGWFGEDGVQHEEAFDMVVLAVGARPPAGMDKLALAAGIDLMPNGFVETQYFSPARTSRHGVFAGGAFGAPRDIAESVIQAGAAAQGAARLIKIHDFLAGMAREPEPEYPDVSRQSPKVLVAMCTSCPILESGVDLEALSRRLERLHTVCHVARVGSACTGEGWGEIERLADEIKPNRVLIGACMPYAYVPKLKELGRAIGLNPALMDVVDIYTPTFSAGQGGRRSMDHDVYSSLATAVARLQGADPVPPPVTVDVAKRALVVGGGLAGMTAAVAIADHGLGVCLVEQEEELGGLAMRLHSTLEGADPRKHMEELIAQVEKHPNITVLKDSRVALSRGTAGRFRTAIATPEGPVSLEHGVTLLATGGHESNVYDYGFRVHKSVMTQFELEEALATGTLDTQTLGGVAMIQCWRSREEGREYCSRVCCSQAIKNVLALKVKNPRLPVTVFYRDIMTYGFKEQYYTQARKAGALFVRYDLDSKPQVAFENDKPVITAFDPVLGRKIAVHADLLVLSAGVEPNEVDDLVEIFGVETNRHGFFQEAESKWRPVDFLKQGIYMCGLAHSPMTMSEAVASAQAAAQRALRILNAETIARETVVAQVRHSLCSLCQKCVAACPYGARTVDLENEIIEVDEILCQGCGACAAVCPNSATVLTGFHDGPIMAVIDAALEDVGLEYPIGEPPA